MEENKLDLSSRLDTDIENNILVKKYAPYLVFQHDEVCYPIQIQTYLDVCKNEFNIDEGKIIDEESQALNSASLYALYKEGRNNLQLKFQDPVADSQKKIAGNINDAYGYAKIMKVQNMTRIIYYYLFSHTEAYNCCYFGFPMNKYAHRGDLKYIIVDIDNNGLNKVYFGAHGSQSGVWRNVDQLIMSDNHVLAFSAKHDHSFYPEPGIYPRIYFVAYDVCKIAGSRICKPDIIINYDETDSMFLVEKSGWNYFPGTMNDQGIDAPYRQGFWHGKIADVSNNWFKRLFCCNFF